MGDNKRLADLLPHWARYSLWTFLNCCFSGPCIDLMHLQLSLVADAENRPLYHLYCLADYSRTLEYHTRLHWPLRIQPRLSPARLSGYNDWLHLEIQSRWQMDTLHSENCAFHRPSVDHLGEIQMQPGICHCDVLPKSSSTTVLLTPWWQEVGCIVVGALLGLCRQILRPI